MQLNPSPTELTTGATDAVLALECVLLIRFLSRHGMEDRWKTGLWCWTFGLLALASALGAFAHGFALAPEVRSLIWKPLYLSLGLLVALFLVGAIRDFRGQAFAARLLPWAIALGVFFYALTEWLHGAFFLFVAYEAVVMATVFCLYVMMGFKKNLKGAWVVSLGILLNLVAAAVQASDISFHWMFSFDHNGVFHLVQMMALGFLAWGLRSGMENPKSKSEAAG